MKPIVTQLAPAAYEIRGEHRRLTMARHYRSEGATIRARGPFWVLTDRADPAFFQERPNKRQALSLARSIA